MSEEVDVIGFVNALRDADPLRREQELDRLDELSPVHGWVACRILLNDSEELVRSRAAELMEDLADARDGFALICRLEEDPSELVRASAASSLVMVGDETAKRALISRMFRETDSTARRYIASALGRFGDPKVAPVLAYVLEHEEDPHVRSGILGALYLIGDQEVTAQALASLMDLLRSDDYLSRCQVLSILVEDLRRSDAGSVSRELEELVAREKHPAVLDMFDRLQRRMAETIT